MGSSVISKGSLVLVVGANGFLGAHIVDQILAAGYKVRGTVRHSGKAKWVSEYFVRKYGQDVYESVVLEDLGNLSAIKSAVRDCEGVVLVASDVSFRTDPKDVIDPTVKAAKNALDAAAAEPSVRRFVYTSSAVAAAYPTGGRKIAIDGTTWNAESLETAFQPPPHGPDQGGYVYAASKILAERACWDFQKVQREPIFVLNTVLPDFVTGESLEPDRQQPYSGRAMKGIYDNKQETVDFMKNFPLRYMVDVKDVARLHLAALVEEDVKNERLFASAESFDLPRIVACMRRLSPEKALPIEVDGGKSDLSTIDSDRSAELLKRMGRPGYMTLEDSLRDSVFSH